MPIVVTLAVTILVTGDDVVNGISKGVYVNAPLAMVVLEVRFPSEASAAPVTVSLQRAFRDRLVAHGDWIIEAQQVRKVEVEFGSNLTQSVQTQIVPRLVTRDRTMSVSLPPGAITIETTRYDGYDEFRGLVETVLAAAKELLNPDGVVRFGMRYIDEIQVPQHGNGDLSAWANWLLPPLLPPRLPESISTGSRIETWASAAQYRFGEDRFMIVRYGPQPLPVVHATTPLRRLNPPPQVPVFVIDFDSYWQPEAVPAFDLENLIGICDLLHEPASDSFEAFITPALRDVFRGEA
jgi:uncharacterized protein (TIGR04255 family)